MEVGLFQYKDDIVNWLMVEHQKRAMVVIGELRQYLETTRKQLEEVRVQIIDQTLAPVYKNYVGTFAPPTGAVTTTVQLDKSTIQLAYTVHEIVYTLDVQVDVGGDVSATQLYKRATLPKESILWELYDSLSEEERSYCNKIARIAHPVKNQNDGMVNQIRACLTELSLEGVELGKVLDHPKMSKVITPTI